jgi:hypothetical protein
VKVQRGRGGSEIKKKNNYYFYLTPPPVIVLIKSERMNHMELGPSTIIGIALIIVGILLYALKKREPYVSRGVIFRCTLNHISTQ